MRPLSLVNMRVRFGSRTALMVAFTSRPLIDQFRTKSLRRENGKEVPISDVSTRNKICHRDTEITNATASLLSTKRMGKWAYVASLTASERGGRSCPLTPSAQPRRPPANEGPCMSANVRGESFASRRIVAPCQGQARILEQVLGDDGRPDNVGLDQRRTVAKLGGPQQRRHSR